jgi:hypothetical protein
VTVFLLGEVKRELKVKLQVVVTRVQQRRICGSWQQCQQAGRVVVGHIASLAMVTHYSLGGAETPAGQLMALCSMSAT